MLKHFPVFLPLAFLLFFQNVRGQTAVERDIFYHDHPGPDNYTNSRCKLDVYLPKGVSNFPVLIWFYGGALKSGNKADPSAIADTFAKQGIGVVVPDYRLSPKATFPAYIEDAAAAVAWTKKHAQSMGGDPRKIFVGGHSAGAYLAFMLAMDTHFLKDAGVGQEDVAGFIPISGQTMTHFTVREERGIGQNNITADEAAPIFYTRKNTQPLLIILGDADWPTRLEENEYFASALKASGNTRVQLKVIPNRDHGSIVGKIPEAEDPCARLIRNFILTPVLPPQESKADS